MDSPEWITEKSQLKDILCVSVSRTVYVPRINNVLPAMSKLHRESSILYSG